MANFDLIVNDKKIEHTKQILNVDVGDINGYRGCKISIQKTSYRLKKILENQVNPVIM